MIVMMQADKAILSLFQRKDFMTDEECLAFMESYTLEATVTPLPIDIQLQHSQYTITQRTGRTYVLYNTLYNSMLTMSDTEYQQYQQIDFTELNLIGTLVDNGFLIPMGINEFERYSHYQEVLGKLYPMPSHYTVVLTTKCNARCVYCYEEGVQQFDMSLETAERFAALLLNTQKDIDITWFGGEPLLKTELIDRICDILCKNNVPFTGGIITNGSLLDDEMIETKLADWHVNWLQISLDGMAEEYARRKCYIEDNRDYFSRVIENIGRFLDNDIAVSVRFNMDADNSEDCVKAAHFLKEKFPNDDSLDVYPAFLIGNNALSLSERNHYSKAIYQLYEPSLNLLSEIPRLCPCFFRQPGAFVIDADGSILCCDRDVGKQHTKIASIFDIENFDELNKPKGMIPDLRKPCQSCVYYPKCGGGCEAAYHCGCSYDACFMQRYQTEYLINKITGK